MAVLSVRELDAREEGRRREPLTRAFEWPGRSTTVSENLFPTRALSRFVKALSGRTAPVVIDLGQAVGANVTFLGDQLGCKLHVEDLLSDLETWGPPPVVTDADKREAGGDGSDETPGPPVRVLNRPNDSVDGILCWDVIDHLDQEAGQALGREITRVLSPGGVVFLCHAAEKCQIAGPIQHEIVDEMTLRYRESQRVVPQSRVWQSRAITGIFSELSVSDSFLLTNRMREVVFRKAPAPAAAD